MIHETGQAIIKTFSTSSFAQETAQNLLKQLSLDDASLEQLESKWSIAWSDEWKNCGGKRQ